MLSEYDLHLLGEGNHHRSYECLGAHPLQGKLGGVRFVVWAPHARRISVVGDFNGWDATSHPMQPVGGFGLWGAEVPQATAGQRYKYRLEKSDGVVADKADPYAFASELRPDNASVIHEPRHQWSDAEWL